MGQVDLIVTNYPNSRLSHGDHIRTIHSFRDCFIASSTHYKELMDKKLHLKDLLDYPIMMLDRKSTTSEFLHHLFQQHQLDLVPEIELGSNDLLIDLARIGLGIAFVPDYCIPDDGELFPLDIQEELPGRTLVIAHNPQLPLTKAAKEFLNHSLTQKRSIRFPTDAPNFFLSPQQTLLLPLVLHNQNTAAGACSSPSSTAVPAITSRPEPTPPPLG